jgi:hypothetical protein
MGSTSRVWAPEVLQAELQSAAALAGSRHMLRRMMHSVYGGAVHAVRMHALGSRAFGRSR